MLDAAAGMGRSASSVGAAPVALPSVVGGDEVTGDEVTGDDDDVEGREADEAVVRDGLEPCDTDDEVSFSLSLTEVPLAEVGDTTCTAPVVSLQPESRAAATASVTIMCGNFGIDVNSFHYTPAKGLTLALTSALGDITNAE